MTKEGSEICYFGTRDVAYFQEADLSLRIGFPSLCYEKNLSAVQLAVTNKATVQCAGWKKGPTFVTYSNKKLNVDYFQLKSHRGPVISSRGLSKGLNIMKAIRVAAFGGPDVLEYKTDAPLPQPAEDEVLVNIKAAGVNPVETYIRAGAQKSLPTLPFTPGLDGAGVIEKVGSKVNKFKPGDRVFVCRTVSGSYAEFATVKESSAYPLAAGLDYKQGAALGIPYFTAYRALCIKANVKAGQKVLIHGASGGVGNACIQIAKSCGLTVYGTAGSEQGMDFIKKLGCDQVFNHREAGYEKKIMEATNDCGVDCIVEMLANVNMQRDLDLLAVNGILAIVGSRGDIEISPRSIMVKECKVYGVSIGKSTEDEFERISSAIVKGTESGELVPVIGKEYPLDQASQAHQDIINTKSAMGRLVLIP